MEKPHPGMHVGMHCETHPDRHYSCKVIAVSRSGRYNGCRNIFYLGYERECDCPGSALIIDDESRATLDAFHADN